MALVLSERAADEVKQVMQQQKLEEGLVLRVGLAGGGCSGFQHSVGFDKNYDAKVDFKYDYHGVMVVVDKKSALYLDSTTLDFYEDPQKRGFVFDDPSAMRGGGCSSCSA